MIIQNVLNVHYKLNGQQCSLDSNLLLGIFVPVVVKAFSSLPVSSPQPLYPFWGHGVGGCTVAGPTPGSFASSAQGLV